MTNVTSTPQILQPALPYRFDHSLAFIQGFAPCSADHVCERNRLVTGGFVDERPFIAHVRSKPGTDELMVQLGWPETSGDPQDVNKWITRFLSLDDNLQPLYQAAAGDAVFSRVITDLYGYHHVRFPTAFEAACWAALSQRTSWQVSRKFKQNLVKAAGEVIKVDHAQVALFPTPARILANGQAVAEMISDQRKRRTIFAAAEAFLAEDLYTLDDTHLESLLQGIWGFGAWSSEFILLRGFGRLSRIPFSERRLRQAVARLYGLDKPEADEDDLRRLGKRYGEYIGYWAHYIRVWIHQRTAQNA